MARCTQCDRPYEPSPRAVGRQVTCGDPACRRRQHAAACRRWRSANPEAIAHHYDDVVVPFRARRTAYQREWRILRALREIRDDVAHAVGDVDRRILDLLARGAGLFPAHAAGHARVDDARALAITLTGRLAEIAALIDQIEALVRSATGRDTRRD